METMYDFHVTKNKLRCYFSLVPFSKELADGNSAGVASDYYTWFYNQEVTKFNSHGLFPQSVKEFEDFFDSINNKNNLVLAIIDIDKKKHVGNISLQSINWINRSAEFAVIIGKPDYWGCGISAAAGKILFEHGFEKLGLNRIWTGTSVANIGMRNVAKKLGMTEEGVFREGMFIQDAFADVIAYGILKEDWYEQRYGDN